MRFAYRPYDVDPSPADPARVSYRPDLLVLVGGAAGPTDGVPIWGILDPAAIDCILPHDAADRIKPVCAAKCGPSPISLAARVPSDTGVSASKSRSEDDVLAGRLSSHSGMT